MLLLVEDNPSDEKLMLRAFKKNNFAHEMIVARDGAEAIDFLFSQGRYQSRDITHQPKLILLDIKLPKMDGIQVLRQIRSNQHTKFIPVVMLTTSDEQLDLLQSYEFHANSFIRKPIDFTDFVETVKHIGLYWLVLNQTP